MQQATKSLPSTCSETDPVQCEYKSGKLTATCRVLISVFVRHVNSDVSFITHVGDYGFTSTIYHENLRNLIHEHVVNCSFSFVISYTSWNNLKYLIASVICDAIITHKFIVDRQRTRWTALVYCLKGLLSLVCTANELNNTRLRLPVTKSARRSERIKWHWQRAEIKFWFTEHSPAILVSREIQCYPLHEVTAGLRTVRSDTKSRVNRTSAQTDEDNSDNPSRNFTKFVNSYALSGVSLFQ